MSESRYQGESLVPPTPVIPVSVLNRLAREKLESAFPLCWVGGEISNIAYAASGHVYFSLKDAAAQVRCVMFRNRAQFLGWRLENGQRIEARVLVTLYEARGDFQLNIETACKAGMGTLYEQFLVLKDKFQREGLFDPEGKRQIPAFPKRVGIVTSLQAAALRDALTTLARRAPQIDIVLYPTPVQGEDAAVRIADALRTASARKECDVLILCRGGGSLEDLWAFNDEALARAIRACVIPVVCGIGHETDFTIADFAADRRAPTPTAAAELAAPERVALVSRLQDIASSLSRRGRQALDQRYQHLDSLALRLRHPARQLEQILQDLHHLKQGLDHGLQQSSARGRNDLARLTRRLLLSRPDTGKQARRLEALAPKLQNVVKRELADKTARLARLEASLSHLNPLAVLARGYSIVTDETGTILRDTLSLEPNDRIAVTFHAGRANATVDAVSNPTQNDT